MNIKSGMILAVFLWVCTQGSISHAVGVDAKGWFQEGNRFSAEGNLEQAVEAYQQSIEMNPKSPAAHFNLGLAYKKTGDNKNAARAFEKTLALEPSHMDAHVSLGNVYNRLERWQDAIGTLNVVVHRRQNDAEAHGNLGWAYYNYKDGPGFKLLVIANLKKAVILFQEQNMRQAAEATEKVLEEARQKFSSQKYQ